MDRRTVLLTSLASAALVGSGGTSALAAPKAVLWERWVAHDATAETEIDHGTWGEFLKSYLATGSDGVNRLAYGEVTAEDAAALKGYIEGLAAVPISAYARPQQMAYWINLYNALTVQVILDHYPVDSIRDIDISPGFFSSGPWGKKLVTIENETVSLDDIEHQILRPIWKDPRIHYAVNCASIGCPNLQPAPFQASQLDRQLDQAAIEFVNHLRGVDIREGRAKTSSIYAWFEEDFGGDDKGVIAHLKAFAEPDLAMKLEKINRIADHDYDWQLNDLETSTG
ncbi:MAG: DUF547 domain-containing protein [Pseudomonadota bacterium]